MAPGRLALCLLLVAGCVGGPVRGPAPARAPGPAARLDDPGLLLLLSDRRMYEPYSVRQIFDNRPDQHLALAVALGRIGDPRARQLLEELLVSGRAEVRREAAFALGQLGDAAAIPSLLASLADSDRETGREAVAALARLQAPLVAVVAGLEVLALEERQARLLPPLFRFPAADLLDVARTGLGAAEPGPRRRAAYALARKAVPEARDELRALLVDSDPWLRGWGARALGRVGDASDVARLWPLVAGAEAGPTLHALRALASLVGRGRAAAPAAWLPRLLELVADPRPGVRVTAIEASAAWLRDERLATALTRLARDGEAFERAAAVVAMAAGDETAAAELAARAAVDGDPIVREAAVAAAARLGRVELLDRLAGDRSPAVRVAQLAARLELAGERGGLIAREALLDTDPGVRTAALDWLTERPLAPIEELALALAEEGGGRLESLRVSGTRAIGARGAVEVLERGVAVAALEELAGDRSRPVRRAAAAALVVLGRPAPAVGPAETEINLRAYRELVERAKEEMRVQLVTTRGVITVRLEPGMAPLTCLNFLQLVGVGFYDGVAFHRVVPDFVVQAGDPRGDGWGGPGYSIRDENNRMGYTRGTLGMARLGPDTAGSQFFITLSEQPHLEGDYTAFGRVIDGFEVLDALVRGDRIESARRLGESEPGV